MYEFFSGSIIHTLESHTQCMNAMAGFKCFTNSPPDYLPAVYVQYQWQIAEYMLAFIDMYGYISYITYLEWRTLHPQSCLRLSSHRICNKPASLRQAVHKDVQHDICEHSSCADQVLLGARFFSDMNIKVLLCYIYHFIILLDFNPGVIKIFFQTGDLCF